MAAQRLKRINAGDTTNIGDVKDSVLTEAQFQSLNGYGWILTDGRSIVGSRLHSLFGFTTATDIRGQFRRAKNNGRVDGNQDPGGERAIGNIQGQATARNGLALSDPGHAHGISFWQPSGGANGLGGGASSVRSGTNSATTGITLGAWDAETRPRNIAFNVFIKIN